MFAALHRLADDIPAPAAIMAGLTVPWWREWLASVSEALAIAAQILAVLLALYKLWEAYRSSAGQTDAAMSAANAVGVAAKKASLASGSIAGVAAAFLGVFAITSWLSHANAAPATPAKLVSSTTASRKRTKDDAGEDATSDAEAIEGAPTWYDEGRALVGTEEKIANGRRSNPVVLQMFEDAGHPEVRNTDTPWCAAFVGAMLERRGIACTKALTARSYLKWGTALDEPKPGCIVVMWRGPRDDGFSGHIGFYVRDDGDYFWMLGGNQGDAVSVARFPKRKILGYRWPRGLMNSKTVQGAIVAKAAATGTAGTLATVAAGLPPEPPKPSAAAHAADAIEQIKGPFETLQGALPSGNRAALYIAIALCALTVVGTSLVIYRKWVDRNSGDAR